MESNLNQKLKLSRRQINILAIILAFAAVVLLIIAIAYFVFRFANNSPVNSEQGQKGDLSAEAIKGLTTKSGVPLGSLSPEAVESLRKKGSFELPALSDEAIKGLTTSK